MLIANPGLVAFLNRANPRPSTREAWVAQVREWQGRANIESLLVWGGANGWTLDEPVQR